MSKTSKLSPINVPCKLCENNISLNHIKDHILNECLPNFLNIYGLKDLLPTLKEYQAIKNEMIILKEENSKLRYLSFSSTSSTSASNLASNSTSYLKEQIFDDFEPFG